MESAFDVAERVAETLDVGPGTRLFEVDCGDGDLLVPFYENGFVVGGSDGDPAMLERAVAAMPEGSFTVATAAALDPAVPWDVVICRSLSGLPDSGSMRGLVARMFAKATHAIALLDVPEPQQGPLMRALAEAGAGAIQIEGRDVYARVQ